MFVFCDVLHMIKINIQFEMNWNKVMNTNRIKSRETVRPSTETPPQQENYEKHISFIQLTVKLYLKLEKW